MAGDSHLLLSHIAHSEVSGNGLSLKPAGNVPLLTSTRQSGVWIALDGIPYRKIVLWHARTELCRACWPCRLEQQTRPSRLEGCCRSCSGITGFWVPVPGAMCILAYCLTDSSCCLKGKSDWLPSVCQAWISLHCFSCHIWLVLLLATRKTLGRTVWQSLLWVTRTGNHGLLLGPAPGCGM